MCSATLHGIYLLLTYSKSPGSSTCVQCSVITDVTEIPTALVLWAGVCFKTAWCHNILNSHCSTRQMSAVFSCSGIVWLCLPVFSPCTV